MTDHVSSSNDWIFPSYDGTVTGSRTGVQSILALGLSLWENVSLKQALTIRWIKVDEITMGYTVSDDLMCRSTSITTISILIH